MHKQDAPVIIFMVLLALVMCGIGYLISIEMEHSSLLKEQCIAAGKQVVEGNCINE